MKQSLSEASICPEHQPKTEEPLARLVKHVLLFSDGSTTRLLQSLVGRSLDIKVHHQTVVEQQHLPPARAKFFPQEGPFLYRISSLYVGPTVLSTNLVYAHLRSLPETLQTQLSAGTYPLGSLISAFETRRDLLKSADACSCSLQPLFRGFTLTPQTYAMKEYNIIFQEKCWF